MNTKNTSRIPTSYRPKSYAKVRTGAALADADLPLPRQEDALNGKRTGVDKLLPKQRPTK